MLYHYIIYHHLYNLNITAIRFVLSDEYTNLQKEERQALIHVRNR